MDERERDADTSKPNDLEVEVVYSHEDDEEAQKEITQILSEILKRVCVKRY